MHKVPYLIAEVKTDSPFGYHSDKSWDELFEIASSVGDMISIHTDERWGGSFDLLSRAVNLSEKPILAKGIHESDDEVRRALDLGAHAVLVVGRLPNPEPVTRCLLEPTDLNQLAKFTSVTERDQRYAWNRRNLANGTARDVSEYSTARTICTGWLCQASMIVGPKDVEPTADAILVGENLAQFADLL